MSSSSLTLPKAAEPLLSRFSIAFTRPTFQRAMLLLVGFVPTKGRRTVTRTLWFTRVLREGRGHFSSYHRVLCRAPWSLWPLGRVLAAMLLELIPAGQAVVLAVDETATSHPGKRVYGKGRHRDAAPLDARRVQGLGLGPPLGGAGDQPEVRLCHTGLGAAGRRIEIGVSRGMARDCTATRADRPIPINIPSPRRYQLQR